MRGKYATYKLSDTLKNFTNHFINIYGEQHYISIRLPRLNAINEVVVGRKTTTVYLVRSFVNNVVTLYGNTATLIIE
jgi:DNA gyrase inhibitor GyrI